MQGDQIQYKIFSRRAAILGGAKVALFSVLAGRMYYLQVIEADRYTTLAEENRINLRLLPPVRGAIVDRMGRPLAVNRENYRAVLIAEQSPDIGATLDRLAAVLPLSLRERARILREAGRRRGFVPVTIRENLSWEAVAKIEVNAPDLPGVGIDVGRTRHYPQGEAAAHVIGYVGAVSEGELSDDPALRLPDVKIGKSGVEKTYDKVLRGIGGTSHLEVNALGREIRELSREEGVPGKEVPLSLDAALQGYTYERLKEKAGAAVCLDARNGEIYAMVSTPAYEPNAFMYGLSQESWEGLINDRRTPLVNKAVAGQYAPGSTFKMIVALAALEHGVVTADHRVVCSGYMELGNGRFHCWKEHGHGSLDMVQAIAQSCDVYFYDIARRTGIERIAEMAQRFGLGGATGIDLPGEKPGLVPTKEWKLGVYGKGWSQGETLIVGIGQGYVLSTPLQLAAMTAQLANGGRPVQPRLVRVREAMEESEGDDGKSAGGAENSDLTQGVASPAASPNTAPEMPPAVSAAALSVIVRAMDAVTNTSQGTAFGARLSTKAGGMAGKTGTSQVRRITRAEREDGVLKNRERLREERDHALFVGYAPADDPRYAVAVVVEHGGSGAAVAAPIARDILAKALALDPARHGRPAAIAGLEPVRGG